MIQPPSSFPWSLYRKDRLNIRITKLSCLLKKFPQFMLIPKILIVTILWNNVNFCNLCLKILMEKSKAVGPRFYWNLTFTISDYCRTNVKSHAGWSIFLCNLSENECSQQVSENFRNDKIFHGQKFCIGNNFRRH